MTLKPYFAKEFLEELVSNLDDQLLCFEAIPQNPGVSDAGGLKATLAAALT
jgi:hypothetical protein